MATRQVTNKEFIAKWKQTPTWYYQNEVRTITEMGIALTRIFKMLHLTPHREI